MSLMLKCAIFVCILAIIYILAEGINQPQQNNSTFAKSADTTINAVNQDINDDIQDLQDEFQDFTDEVNEQYLEPLWQHVQQM